MQLNYYFCIEYKNYRKTNKQQNANKRINKEKNAINFSLIYLKNCAKRIALVFLFLLI